MGIDRKNLSLSEFKTFLFTTIESIQNLEQEEIVSYLEVQLNQFLEADFLYVMTLSGEGKYFIHTLGRRWKPNLNSKHLFSEVILKKQPLLLKDLDHNLLYDENDSNLSNEALKEVLLIPVKMQQEGESRYPFLLVWAGLKKHSHEVFSQKQTLYLMKFLDGVKPYLSKVNDTQKLTLEQCLDNASSLEQMMERNKEYFHSIIHDVRTPMNALLGFLDLLALNETDETKKEYLDAALKSGEHMVRLISDALDVAKIESGELPIEKIPFDLHDALADTVKIFYESAQRKNILLCAYIDPEIPQDIISDPYRIKQVLSNLLSNAIKFTPERGSVLIDAVYDAQKGIVTVGVKDTGIGIKREALDDIFVAYRQESSSTERDYGGTGLGLNISYQIVSLLGGRLEVKSTEGEGSTFFFDLPVCDAKENGALVPVEPIERRVRMFRWKKRKDIRAKTLKRYLKSFHANVLLEEQDRSLKEIYEQDDFAEDIVVIEASYLEEEDRQYVQRMLDRGSRVIWIEDAFDREYKQFHGDIYKLSYPVLTKLFYRVLKEKSRVPKESQADQRFSHAAALKNKKILVVDDNRINLKFMNALISRFNMQAELVDDAVDAIEKLAQEQFDMLIIDENMPKMLGSEAIAMIREKIAKSELKPLSIVSLSGDSHYDDRIREAGADEILTKPISIDHLSSVFQKYLLNS